MIAFGFARRRFSRLVSGGAGAASDVDFFLVDAQTGFVVYTYFKDIPRDILEAARLDGATLWQEMVRVLLPIAKGGLASTVLLSLMV